MLRSLNALVGYAIGARDGEMGEVRDFFFDDTSWTIRYLVVETGGWLSRRRVLISPAALEEPDWENRRFPVSLTKEQVRHSPDVDTDKPVARQQEILMNTYYGWPHYWSIEPIFSAPALPAPETPPEEPEPALGDPHVRSFKEVSGYRAEASDGEAGQVGDFLTEAGGWAIRSLVVDTGNWLSGKKVLIPVREIASVWWAGKEVRLRLGREQVESSPAYDAASVAAG